MKLNSCTTGHVSTTVLVVLFVAPMMVPIVVLVMATMVVPGTPQAWDSGKSKGRLHEYGQYQRHHQPSSFTASCSSMVLLHVTEVRTAVYVSMSIPQRGNGNTHKLLAEETKTSVCIGLDVSFVPHFCGEYISVRASKPFIE